MANTDSKTRFLILSDTHGEKLQTEFDPGFSVDVLIHCGDLTSESKLQEFHTTLKALSDIKASLKLVIPGNHDFTLDKVSYSALLDLDGSDKSLVEQYYGRYGEVLDIFATYPDIQLLDEGSHKFNLANGTILTVYASSYTPSEGNMGFRYPPNEDHYWDIGDADIVITHGPPRGVMDRTVSRERAGCPGLFAAVARQRPRMHCFGHIHEGWGAKLVRWRNERASEYPSHFTNIDNENSTFIETLQSLMAGKFDAPQVSEEKAKKMEALMLQGFRATSHCEGDENILQKGTHTLFVNASIQSMGGIRQQVPWLVDIELPISF